MRLSDTIEEFIKELLLQAEEDVQLQRNELAEYFGCAPSQINYVLATRFTPEHGYVIKSKRGGGGCIQIFRIVDNDEQLEYLLNKRIGESIAETECNTLLSQLKSRNLICDKEMALIKAALSKRAFSLPINDKTKDELRAKILKEILLELSIQSPEGGNEQ